ncbi:MAG TPA: pitrilysin family protein [Candidatus Omnitrophota bacterium]|nr:pitrilysin family protein [Candidatus Omnitrophota bacterium]
MYKKTVLKNGLRVISHNMPQRQTVSLGIWFGVGGRYESKNNKGIAHFLEHMVFKGSKKYSNRQIKESLEGVGGNLNGFTSEEMTCYLVKIPAQYLKLALDVLSDMAINPLLKPQDIEKERTVIAEEIRMYKDMPAHLVQDRLDELMWPNHPLGLNIAGTEESVSRITKADISNFKNYYYTPANIVVAACGNLKHEKLVEASKSIFNGSAQDKDLSFKEIVISQDKPQVSLFSKDTEQTHVSIGFHSLKRGSPDRHVLGLLNVILGANMSSRLFNEVREKRGLVYAISSFVRRFHDAGAFTIHAGTDNKKFIEVIKVIITELNKIKKSKPTSSELKRAKEYYIGQLTIELEDTLDHMIWIGESTMALDKTYTYGQILDQIKKINLDDILRISDKIFKNQNINLAVVGQGVDRSKKNIQEIFKLD